MEEEQQATKLKTKCTLCGLCKFSCPAYKVLFDEAVSPRGKAVMLKSNIPSKHLHVCTLCKACENVCTVPGIDLVSKIRKSRESMVKAGNETEAGKRLMENIRQHGTCMGKLDDSKKIDVWEC